MILADTESSLGEVKYCYIKMDLVLARYHMKLLIVIFYKNCDNRLK